MDWCGVPFTTSSSSFYYHHCRTDLVVKRSFDGGATWGDVILVYGNSTAAHYYSIGNAAPVVDANTGVTHCFC